MAADKEFVNPGRVKPCGEGAALALHLSHVYLKCLS